MHGEDSAVELFLDGHRAGRLLESVRRLLKAAPGARRAPVSFDLDLSEREVEVVGGGGEEAAVLVGGGTGESSEAVRVAIGPLAAMARRARNVYRLPGEAAGAAPAPVADPGGDDDDGDDGDDGEGGGGRLGGWEALETWEGGYHQLVSTGRGAPTLEIGGIQMHRTSGVEVFQGAGAMAAACVEAGMRVLDTCGGLGYTAIQAARLGAREVVSAEASPGVLSLRRSNPWSRLERGLPIRLHEGDVVALARGLADASFAAVVHDPPRHALAPELYGESFYFRLWDLLEPGGRLFHYTGEPGVRSHGRDFPAKVAARLGQVGFRVEARPELQGLLATRRRSPAGGPRAERSARRSRSRGTR
jgi:hypothetical protein